MDKGLVMPSIVTATSLSFGARNRNVTVLSPCTSGEITGVGGVCARPQAAPIKNANESKNGRFFISPCPQPAAPLIQVLFPKLPSCRMIQQPAQVYSPGYKRSPLLPGISSHAAAALATDKPAQISIMSRNPNTNASRTDSLIAVPVVSFRLVGNCRPASLISPA